MGCWEDSDLFFDYLVRVIKVNVLVYIQASYDIYSVTMKKDEHLGNGVTVKRTYTDDVTPILIEEKWWVNYQLHRVDGPASQEWTIVNGEPILTSEAWWLNNQLYRVDGPAVQVWDIVNNKHILTLGMWCLNSRFHRVDGPAFQQWEIVNGEPILTSEIWSLNGELHRVDRPAIQRWGIVNDEHILTQEEWYLDNKLHRDGYLPANLQGQHWKKGVRYELDKLHGYGRTILRFMKWCRMGRRRRQWALAAALKNRYGFRDVVSVIVGYT